MRVIDIESNWTEDILHASVGNIHTIDKILIFTSNYNLEKEKEMEETKLFKNDITLWQYKL